jgi:hypothetical protein
LNRTISSNYLFCSILESKGVTTWGTAVGATVGVAAAAAGVVDADDVIV